MTEQDFKSQLLQQAGLSAGTLPAHDREVLRQRIERLNRDLRRIKRWLLVVAPTLVLSIIVLIIGKTGHDKGVFAYLAAAGTIGILAALYSLLGLFVLLAFHRFALRAAEITQRLANMEGLMESMATILERISQRLDKPSPTG